MFISRLILISFLILFATSQTQQLRRCSCPIPSYCDILAQATDMVVALVTARGRASFSATVQMSYKSQFQVGQTLTIYFNSSCVQPRVGTSALMSLTMEGTSLFLDQCGIFFASSNIPSALSRILANIPIRCPKFCVENGNLHPSGSSWNPTPCEFCTCTNGMINCAIMDCARPPCENYFVPEGKCCPICPQIQDQTCADVICPVCEHPLWIEGECCCQEACVPQKCNLECPGGFQYDDKGCPLCQCLICPKIACFLPPCDNPVMFPGTCCPSCPVDCSLVRCAAPQDCHEWYIPQNQCCPVCLVPDACLEVVCPPLDCPTTVQNVGECCKTCVT